MGIKRFEERIERFVEGSLTRPFRSQLQPVEIGRRLTREMDLQRRVGPRGSLVAPNTFSITLSPDDVERFSHYVDALVRELAEAAREHAEIEGYSLVGPVEVDIFESSRLKPGQIEIHAEVQEGTFPTDLILPDGRRVPVGENPLVIGRLPECDIVLNDPNVSRRHAQIAREGTDIVVRDLGSTNGVKVGGKRVQVAVIYDGDEIDIGATRIVLEAP
jgi:Protein of unknown function (DUF3662)/FHA domain